MEYDLMLDERRSEIEGIMRRFMPEEEGETATVKEAMNYSFSSGSKRIRSMLMLETYRLFGGTDMELIGPFMAAIEMIHTYSLVHDDLPCMDNDDYRRGKKTAHVVYGEAMALLSGDALLNYAFETAIGACKAAEGKSADASEALTAYRRIMRALGILAEKAGINGMIGGQVMDMETDESNISLDRLNTMYNLKTGALIEASMMVGAILAGAVDEDIERIRTISADIGLAFQIRDDILDVTGSTQELGKPAHSDEKNRKITYAALLGVDKAGEEVDKLSRRAVREYEEFAYNNDFLKELILRLISRKK
jgi:geranylgeranyl diphosphate synthase type II